MAEEFNRKTEGIREKETKGVNIRKVPDWRYEPGTPLTEIGGKIKNFSILHMSETVSAPHEVLDLRKYLKGQESALFNGPLVNVEAITDKDGEIIIETKETSFFDYVASGYYFRNNQSENPIRPLAVQATLLAPDGKRVIIEKRSKALTDMPDRLTEFGGALKSGETDLIKAIQERLKKKWGLKVSREAIVPTGLTRENVNNIYCANFVVEIAEEQYEKAKEKGRDQMRRGEKMYYEVSAEEATRSIEKIFLGKRDINKWEPLGYYNILYALVRRGLRKKEDIEKFFEKVKKLSEERPFEYTYPMEKYLPKE